MGLCAATAEARLGAAAANSGWRRQLYESDSGGLGSESEDS